jgi:hypothetical protein
LIGCNKRIKIVTFLNVYLTFETNTFSLAFAKNKCLICVNGHIFMTLFEFTAASYGSEVKLSLHIDDENLYL